MQYRLLAGLVAAAALSTGTMWADAPVDSTARDGTDPSFRDMALIDYSSVVGSAASSVSMGVLQDESAGGAAEQMNTPQLVEFGDAGTWRLNFGGWYSDNFDQASAYAATAGVSYFLVDDLSLVMDLGFAAFDQDGPDAWGANFTLLFRWHFFSNPGWSAYVDAGAGVLKTNDDVPDNGSSFNFTPQAGAGLTFDVGRDWRAYVGARWHHISNANTADSNPGRDSVQLYAGLSVPF